MICPRRVESNVFKLPKEDTWRNDNTCSCCGSLNPDTLMQRLEAGDVEVTPTDKSYKIYVGNSGGQKFLFEYRNCPRDSKCSGPDDCAHWVTEERDRTKFYFQHLSDQQMHRFIELHNDKKLRLAHPGYFYVRPFFCGQTK